MAGEPGRFGASGCDVPACDRRVIHHEGPRLGEHGGCARRAPTDADPSPGRERVGLITWRMAGRRGRAVEDRLSLGPRGLPERDGGEEGLGTGDTTIEVD